MNSSEIFKAFFLIFAKFFSRRQKNLHLSPFLKVPYLLQIEYFFVEKVFLRVEKVLLLLLLGRGSFNSRSSFSRLISYILQTSPIFKFSISNLAKGQPKQGKLYFAKIFSALGNFKIFAKVVSAIILFLIFSQLANHHQLPPWNQSCKKRRRKLKIKLDWKPLLASPLGEEEFWLMFLPSFLDQPLRDRPSVSQSPREQ